MRAPAYLLAASAAALLGLSGVVAVGAQPRVPVPSRPPAIPSPDLDPSPARRGALAQRPYGVLTGTQAHRLLQAQGMRETGRLEAAREALHGLLGEVPHHPLVLVELARLHIVRQEWGALERLARVERTATRDSVLLGHELALALERQGRARDAARVAVEVWAAAPPEAEWAEATLSRLAELDSRGAREALRRAAEARPQRGDLVRAAARLEWNQGDGATALRLLAAVDATGLSTPARWAFAEELLRTGTARDTSGALEALLELASDATREAPYRLAAARRAWHVAAGRREARDEVLRITRALSDLPPQSWAADLLVGLVRALREAGHTGEVRALLGRLGDRRAAYPELALEAALNELREGPPGRALATLEQAARGTDEGVFRYAEALFFAGLPDSAARLYGLVSRDARGAFTGAALERLFLIEDAEPRAALPALGRMAYEAWRGEPQRAAALAESLYRALPRGAVWAYAALELAGYREREGDATGALAPLLAVADSLPGDRLAPVARQRAGDVYRLRLQDDARALAQYEECLARYPRAWNAPEVRRAVETLRRERRF